MNPFDQSCLSDVHYGWNSDVNSSALIPWALSPREILLYVRDTS